MEAQTLQGFTRWSDPRSPASSDVVPATSTKESVVARGLLPKDRRGVRHLARCGASGCLRRTPSHAAAGEAAGRREHTLVVRRAYARALVSAVYGSGEPQESRNGLEGLCALPLWLTR